MCMHQGTNANAALGKQCLHANACTNGTPGQLMHHLPAAAAHGTVFYCWDGTGRGRSLDTHTHTHSRNHC